MGHKGQKRIHRLVTLPDYQGIGIGSALLNAIGNLYSENKINIVTSQPTLYHKLCKSEKWILTHKGRLGKQNGARKEDKTQSSNRVTYSFTYKRK